MPEVLTLIGGFVNGRDMLEPVADTAVKMGLADDAEVVVFRNAMRMDSEILHRKIDGRLVATHSAGALAMREDMRPAKWVAYNGPEPRTPLQLTRSAAQKTFQHLQRAIEGPHHEAYLRSIVSNNIEFAFHPYANLRHIPKISTFSTLGRMAALQEADVPVIGIVTRGDVFFPFDASAVPEDLSVHVVPGGHDELLVNPRSMLMALHLPPGLEV